MNTPFPYTLHHDAFGHLLLRDAENNEFMDVTPVRAHPVSAPEEGIALLAADGHELAWIENLSDLPAQTRALIEQSLQTREFMPEIRGLISVSSFATPSTWEVDTNRGRTHFILKGEEDIRRMPGGILMISDAHGIQFMIRNLTDLDRHSRRLLDRFL